MSLDDTGVADTSYGPAGYFEAGKGFARRYRARPAKS